MERFREPRCVPWDRTSWLTLFSLILIWVLLFSLTWGRWGNVTIDSGREMYAPSALASGKTLYVDVWYPYTPAAPYLNAVLFRLFGVKLSVLYWAGALAALSCAFLLYSTGLHFGSRIAAWTASAAFLIHHADRRAASRVGTFRALVSYI